MKVLNTNESPFCRMRQYDPFLPAENTVLPDEGDGSSKKDGIDNNNGNVNESIVMTAVTRTSRIATKMV